MDSIIIKVNLNGIIGGPIRHTNRQKWTVALSPEEGGSMTRMIHHTDREQKTCIRTVPVSSQVVTSWVKGDCPAWENPKDWRKMNENQKAISHILRFDEGFGVDFETLGDGGE